MASGRWTSGRWKKGVGVCGDDDHLGRLHTGGTMPERLTDAYLLAIINTRREDDQPWHDHQTKRLAREVLDLRAKLVRMGYAENAVRELEIAREEVARLREDRVRLVEAAEHFRYCDVAGKSVEFRCERCVEAARVLAAHDAAEKP
ncbi:MAG: hypothetical protein A2V88_02755 [Elusimicrobia bacterium RBG_16_66_12]|nr:MAG: hypothetical protein A2V88_02755 [Elusimicrobia bacterium RBG_16_66_12]